MRFQTALASAKAWPGKLGPHLDIGAGRGFPSRQMHGVCAEIMFNQKAAAR
jgi:16S rRNA G527 N7-methylase RsmG